MHALMLRAARRRVHPRPAPCPLPSRPPQLFWLFLIFYGMPAQLSVYHVPSQCEWFKDPTQYGYAASTLPAGYCCNPDGPAVSPTIPACADSAYLQSSERGVGRAVWGCEDGACSASRCAAGHRARLLAAGPARPGPAHTAPTPCPCRSLRQCHLVRRQQRRRLRVPRPHPDPVLRGARQPGLQLRHGLHPVQRRVCGGAVVGRACAAPGA